MYHGQCFYCFDISSEGGMNITLRALFLKQYCEYSQNLLIKQKMNHFNGDVLDRTDLRYAILTNVTLRMICGNQPSRSPRPDVPRRSGTARIVRPLLYRGRARRVRFAISIRLDRVEGTVYGSRARYVPRLTR